MASTSGRYKDVARAQMPGELPPESQHGAIHKRSPASKGLGKTRASKGRASIGLHAADNDERADHQAGRGDARQGMATSRLAGHLPVVMHGVVDDPNPILKGRRQRAAINIKTDGLQQEYARGRISEAGYRAAMTYRAVLEKSRRPLSGGGAWNPGDRVDHGGAAHDLAVLNRIERAQDADAMLRDTAPVIGLLGQRILELVLVDEMTIADAAQKIRGRRDRQTVIFWAEQFRSCCEMLAEHWVRRDGKAPRADL